MHQIPRHLLISSTGRCGWWCTEHLYQHIFGAMNRAGRLPPTFSATFEGPTPPPCRGTPPALCLLCLQRGGRPRMQPWHVRAWDDMAAMRPQQIAAVAVALRRRPNHYYSLGALHAAHYTLPAAVARASRNPRLFGPRRNSSRAAPREICVERLLLHTGWNPPGAALAQHENSSPLAWSYVCRGFKAALSAEVGQGRGHCHGLAMVWVRRLDDRYLLTVLCPLSRPNALPVRICPTDESVGRQAGRPGIHLAPVVQRKWTIILLP